MWAEKFIHKITHIFKNIEATASNPLKFTNIIATFAPANH